MAPVILSLTALMTRPAKVDHINPLELQSPYDSLFSLASSPKPIAVGDLTESEIFHYFSCRNKVQRAHGFSEHEIPLQTPTSLPLDGALPNFDDKKEWLGMCATHFRNSC